MNALTTAETGVFLEERPISQADQVRLDEAFGLDEAIGMEVRTLT